MKKRQTLTAALLLSAGLIAGCATPATITLKDGRILQARDYPDFDDDTGFYEFEQIDDQRVRVNKAEVVTIKDTQ